MPGGQARALYPPFAGRQTHPVGGFFAVEVVQAHAYGLMHFAIAHTRNITSRPFGHRHNRALCSGDAPSMSWRLPEAVIMLFDLYLTS